LSCLATTGTHENDRKSRKLNTVGHDLFSLLRLKSDVSLFDDDQSIEQKKPAQGYAEELFVNNFLISRSNVVILQGVREMLLNNLLGFSGML
jgi:hypothetical protein